MPTQREVSMGMPEESSSSICKISAFYNKYKIEFHISGMVFCLIGGKVRTNCVFFSRRRKQQQYLPSPPFDAVQVQPGRPILLPSLGTHHATHTQPVFFVPLRVVGFCRRQNRTLHTTVEAVYCWVYARLSEYYPVFVIPEMFCQRWRHNQQLFPFTAWTRQPTPRGCRCLAAQ